LSQKIAEYADTLPGLDQYAVRNFATALDVFPKALAENSGVNATEIVNKLHAAHKAGKKNAGFDIDSELPNILDTTTVYDLYQTKYWAMKYAVGAACTILKVDQIIMAKRAGGPKPRQGGANSDDES
jgi:T-complex protein 1 subunit theta